MKAPYLIVLSLVFAACASDVSDTTAPRAQYGKGASPQADPAPTYYISNDAANMMRGDGVATYLEVDGTSRYKNAECDVSTAIFASAGASGDATLQAAASTIRDRKCSAWPRRVRLTYASVNADGTTTDEGSVVVRTFLNVRKLEKKESNGVVSNYVPIGDTQTRSMAFSDENLKCGDPGIGAIIFQAVLNDGTVTGADSVQVHRTAADTWEVFTQSDSVDPVTGQTVHHDKAFCRGNGKLYHMPVHFTIKSNVALNP